MTITEKPSLLRKVITFKGRTNTWMTTAIVFAIAITFTGIDARAQQIFNEDFSTDTAKDLAATTADWDTAPAVTALQLTQSGSAIPIDSLTGAFLPGATSTLVDATDAVSSRAVVAGDLDGDGDLDLAFANADRNSVYFNNGFGVFVRGAQIPDDFISGNSRSAAIADFNGDGHLDVVFAEFGNQATRVHFNNGSGADPVFTAGDFADLGDPAIRGDSIATGDIDNNGSIDVVLGVRGDFVKVFRNDGFGNFSAAEDVTDPLGAGAFRARSVLLGDLDQDGDLDLVAAREEGDTRVYLNNGSGTFGTPQSVAGGVSNNLSAPDSADLGDVDGDGLLDLIIGNDFVGSTALPNPQPNRLYLNSGNSADIFPAVTTAFTDVVNTNSVHFIDVDRDGDLDIVAAAYDLGNGISTPGSDRLYLNTGGAFPAAGTLITADIDVSKSIAPGDFDGDGDIDLVLANDPGTGAPFSTAHNKFVENVGTGTGVFFDQVFATGQSLQVAPGANLSLGVVLRPNTTNAEANRVFQYWLTDDGGLTWIAVEPFRSVAFPAPVGNDLRWRVELNSPSPALRPDLAQLRLTTNRAPGFDSDETDPAVTNATQDVVYTYTVLTSDSDESLLDISATVLPTWLTLTDNDDTTATLTGTPTNDDVGTVGNDVTLQVVDAAGRSDTQSFTIDVANTNDAPVLVPVGVGTGDQTFAQGDTVNFDTSVGFSDPDGDTLTYSATGLPPNLALDPNTGILSGTLTNDDAVGGPDYSVVITADDGNTGTVDDDFTLTVDNVNDAPSFTSTEVTAATEGVQYSYDVVAEDIDGDAVTITAVALPVWLTLTDTGPGTASLSGTPANADIGQVNVTLSVSDGSLTGEQAFSITVVASADAPVITITGDDPATVEQGDTYTDDGATAQDAQDGDLTGSINTTSDVDTDVVGTYTVTYSVTDSAGNPAQAQRVVNVVDTAAPSITLTGGAAVTLTVGDAYIEMNATADDGLNGDISADIVIDSSAVNTGVAGIYTVTYNVTDASGNAATEVTRTVTVNAVVTPPPPPSGGGGGGASSLPSLLLLAGILAWRRRWR
jgi:hypothetical protein